MKSGVHAYTSISTNYIPKARVLAESIKRVQPDVTFHLLLSDDPPAGFDISREPFDNLILTENLPIEDFRQWAFSHRLVELCTAVKGPGLEYIFDEFGAEKVFYFDPDIAVFSRLDELAGELDDSSILLTPHQSEPETTIRGIIDNEICSLRHGVFNLGFLGVSNSDQGRRFSKWWRDRLLHFCRDDLHRSLFTDQKWVNLAPCMFDEIRILRSPAFNVATWNLSTRQATGSLESGILINGEPLGFYHFSGLDSGAQERQLKEYGQHSPILFELREWYLEQCEKHGQEVLGRIPCKYSRYDDGAEITDGQRLLYGLRADLRRTFPDPFRTSGFKDPELTGGYQAWYKANRGADPATGVLSLAPEATVREFLQSASTHLEAFRAEATRTGWHKKLALGATARFLRGLARLAS